ncbi:MAG TPA: HEAT repeat domain-containing protein [Marmoricola sp.]|nr:HEAT repeat domain-containing protein [Marmoricola sp.]
MLTMQVRLDCGRAAPHAPDLLSMNAPSSWGRTPRESIEQECAHRGKEAVIAGCIELLKGRDVDVELVLAVGGPPARWVVTGEPSGPPYWLRVWALRGLLWAWEDVALPSVEAALHDEAWRVREMALRVVARHRLEDALTKVAGLQDDPVARVRAAASRALIRLATSGQ